MKLTEVQPWQRNVATLIKSGLYTGINVKSDRLHEVIGVFPDSSYKVLAKYSSIERANDAIKIISELCKHPTGLN